jgi:hypothetical protein
MKLSLEDVVQKCAQKLPDQRPLPYFVTQNILYMHEHQPFHEAMLEVGEKYGYKGYMSLENYRESLHKNRIDAEILKKKLKPMHKAVC